MIEAIKNYRRRKIRKDMKEAGVFESLRDLEEQGTSWERIVRNTIEQSEARVKEDSQNFVGLAYLIPSLYSVYRGSAGGSGEILTGTITEEGGTGIITPSIITEEK